MSKMIIVTGATGFIGSNLLYGLEHTTAFTIVGVDTFGNGDKWKNVAKRNNVDFIIADDLLTFISENHSEIQAVVHLGAISSTTEPDVDLIIKNNYHLSKDIFNLCLQHSIQFIYASSAATYGDGSKGFLDLDDFEYLSELSPLNAYGWSKKMVDLYISKHKGFTDSTPQVVALKFFNVYGPNEYHKEGQKSVIETFYSQAVAESKIRLFASNDVTYKDGEQIRDFVYVNDCVDVILWFLQHPEHSGLFNVGTGSGVSFNSVANHIIDILNINCDIEYIPIPHNIAKQYQNYTQADMRKLYSTGYPKKMTSYEDGIKDYVTNFLTQQDKYK